MPEAYRRHCEKRSDEATQSSFYGGILDCFASLAMTSGERRPHLHGLESLTSNFPIAPEITKSL
jgi:hypothetical protein